MAEAVLFVELVPTTQGVKRNVEKDLNGSFDAVEKRGTSVFSKIGGLVKGAAIAAGAAAATLTGIAIKGGFERMLKIEDATAKLDGLGHSAQSVDAIMESALAAVRGTAFGLDTAATVAASAVAAGIKPGQELERYLRLTADAATIAGISMDEMGGIINKVTANGRAMTENLNQLQDRGIPILQWLADEYGVTAEAMSKMVSEGKVDAVTFRKVIEDNIGGAALRSGETTRGAWANMLAALSRVGVAMLENVFPYFKTTFQGITVLLDDMTARIGPFGDKVSSLIGLLRSGDFTAEMRELTGWEEDAPVVLAVMRIRDALTGLFDLIVNGDFTSALRDAFNLEEDSPLVVALLAARDAAAQLGPEVMDLAGYFSPLAVVLGVLGPLLPTLLPPLVDLARVLLDLVGVVMPVFVELLTDAATIIAGALIAALPVIVSIFSGLVDVLAGVVGWLGDFSSILGPLAVGILAGAAAFKVWQGAILLWSNVTKAAAAAQALFNAVMSANPIMLIVTAIAALVAGLIWFFTQTELGQEIWANFMSFLGDAWNNIVTIATTVWEGLASFFTDLWTGISDVVTQVWTGIVNFLTPIFEFIGGLIQFQVEVWKNIFLVFAAVLVTVWNWISGVVTTVWEAIVAFLTPIITAIVNFVVGYFTGLFEFWSGIWNSISSFFTGVWEGLMAFLVPIVLSVYQAVAGPIQELSNWWDGIWSSISDFFSGIWNGMVDAVSGAIGDIGGYVGGIFDTVMGALGDVGAWLVDAGGDLVRGFWEGILDMGDWLSDKITGFFDGVIGWAKDVLQIQSPSKVFRMEVGRMVGAGVGLGLEDSEESVRLALESMLPSPDLAAAGAGSWSDAQVPARDAPTAAGGHTFKVYPQTQDGRILIRQMADEVRRQK